MIITNLQKQEFVKRLRKADSTLRQAVLKISVSEGAPVGDFSFMNDDDFFFNFIKEVNTVKICNDNVRGCFTTDYIRTLSGKNWSLYDRKNSIITNDGIAYGWDTSYCADFAPGLTEEDAENCIGRFIVDVNGERNPNQFGYDVFFFIVVDTKGIVPAGNHNDSNCNKNGTGGSCAAKVLKEDRISY